MNTLKSMTVFHSAIFKIAGYSGAIAVVLGALGAHALKSKLTPDLLAAFETAVRYHLIHSLVLFVLGGMLHVQESAFNKSRIVLASKLFLAGMICFSGSIYLLSTRSLWDAEFLKILGPITPIGGILLVAGWITASLSINVNKYKSEN